MSDMTVAELAEDREACKRLLAAYNGFEVFDSDAVDMQAALRALANPAPEVPDEPTDPAVRVVDGDGSHWALVDGLWCSPSSGANHSWSGLWETEGPLTIVTPDPPNAADVQADADDDRPLRVGDLVRVAEDARGWRNGPHFAAGLEVELVEWRDGPDSHWLVMLVDSPLTRGRCDPATLTLIKPGDRP